MPRISQERKDATRRRLVDAAVRVILQEGPAAATTRRILEVAGLSKGAMYHYFASKEELYEAIAEGFLATDAALVVDQAPLEVHALALELNLAPGANTLLGRLRAAALDSQPIRDGLRRFDDKIVAVYSAVNRRSIEDGLFRDSVDPEALVEMIGVFVEGLDLRAATGFVTDRSRVVATFLDSLCDSVLDPAHPDAAELRRRLEKVAAR